MLLQAVCSPLKPLFFSAILSRIVGSLSAKMNNGVWQFITRNLHLPPHPTKGIIFKQFHISGGAGKVDKSLNILPLVTEATNSDRFVKQLVNFAMYWQSVSQKAPCEGIHWCFIQTKNFLKFL